MTEKQSVEERLEKLEAAKSLDQQRRERAVRLGELKNTPIKYVAKDPSRIHKSKKQIIAEKQAKKEEEADFKKFQEERKKEKETKDGMQKKEKKVKVGRPKKVE